MARENPARASRQAFAALFAILAASALIYLFLPLNIAVFFLPFALVGTICMIAVGCIRAEEAKKRAKMERGEGVVAKWSLNARDWQEFTQLNDGAVAVAGRGDAAKPPLSGVEIVFAEDAVYVDGEYHMMDRTWTTSARFDSPYTHIELYQAGLENVAPLRIPVPPAHIPDAERVVRHFNSPP